MFDFTVSEIPVTLRDMPELRARLLRTDNERLLPSDVASAKYTIYLIDEAGQELEVVRGETILDLSAFLNSYATWDEDSIGYNFRFQPDNSTPVITLLGRRYRVEVWVTPSIGTIEPFPVVFDLRAI
jgi:hypothetical protein